MQPTIALEIAHQRTRAALGHANDVSRDYVNDRATKAQKARAWTAHEKAEAAEYIVRVQELVRLTRAMLAGEAHRGLHAVLELFPDA